MALPTLSLLDSFLRTENPLSNGGKWALIQALTHTGQTEASAGYRSADSFAAGEDGAYWTPTEFSNPGVAYKMGVSVGTGERFTVIYLCLQSPTSAEKNGYKIKFVCTTTVTTFNIVIEKISKGSFSTLTTVTGVTIAAGDLIAAQKTGSAIIVWHKSGAGSWTIIAEVEDSAFNKGFVGIGMKGNFGRNESMEAGEGIVVHEHTLSITQASSPSLGHGAIARTFARTQAQAPTVKKTVAHAFTLTQTQSPVIIQATTRLTSPFTISQAQVASRSATASRRFAILQSTVKPTTPSGVTLATLDAFNRANEKPLTGPWAVIGNTVRIGELVSEKWISSDTFAAGEDAAYYTTSQFSNPVFVIEVGVWEMSATERYYSMYVCLQNPGTAKPSGYRARWIETKTGNPTQFRLVIEKMVEGNFTTIAEATGFSFPTSGFPTSTAFTCQAGALAVWTRTGTEWTKQLETTDTTWSSGYVGFGSKGNVGKLDTPQAASRNSASVSATHTRTQTFTVKATASFGPQLPETPVTEGLEEVLGFNESSTWTILSWAEVIGEGRELNKGIIGKPHPKGWGNSEVKKAGARYNVASKTDPINLMKIRSSQEAAETYAAVGICVPSGGEQSGYVARVEGLGASSGFKVTLERWVNGSKSVLAEATLPSGYFGASETGKEAPIALTLVGGVLRLWLAPSSSSAPTVLLSATDSTFSSGYNTMELKGVSWLLSQMHLATMDGNVFLSGVPTNARTLETAQSSSVTRSSQIARSLIVAQASSPTVQKIIGRLLTATQGSTAVLTKTLTKLLSVSQGSSVTRSTALARILSVAQAQLVTRIVALARTLGAEQGQEATVHGGLSSSRTLAAEQAQVVVLQRSVGRALQVGQEQAASRSSTVGRTLAGEQAQAIVLRRLVARELDTTQGSSSAVEKDVSRTLALSQAQEASSSTTPSRRLSAGQAQAVSMRKTIARLLLVDAEQEVSMSEGGHSELLTVGQSQGASLTPAIGRRLTIGQAQAVHRVIALGRTLRIESPQATTMNTGEASVAFSIGQSQHVFAVERFVTPGEPTESPEEHGVTTPTARIGVVGVSMGVVEKEHRRHIGMEGGPVKVKAPAIETFTV